MQFGAHVSAAGGLVRALDRGEEIGAQIVQVHTQSPRVWKPNAYGEDVLAAYREAQAAKRHVRCTVCHASYLINPATSDPVLLAKSRAALRTNLEIASAIGAVGLVLHLGSHLGAGAPAVTRQVARELVEALDDVGALAMAGRPCPILMENAAGAGGTLGRSFAELADVLDAAGADERLGICVDTQHLFASGVGFGSREEADAVVAAIERAIGLDRLRCLHLNDSKVPFGSNRDRHENLGQGCIGATALGWLLGHPALQHVPAVLEVPGLDRKGPTAVDLALARRIHANGRRRWRRLAGAATPPPPPAPPPERGARTGSRRGRSPAGLP